MTTTRILVLCVSVSLCISSTSRASSCNRPDFRGEVWAGEITSPSGNEVVVYWVFDSGGFHEYLHFVASGKTTQIASGHYERMADFYSVSLSRSSGSSTERKASIYFDEQNLQLPTGVTLARMSDPEGWIPYLGKITPKTSSQHVRTLNIQLASATCCGMCYAVHDFFGIGFADSICCFWDGGCDGGGGSFGGGGSSGSW